MKNTHQCVYYPMFFQNGDSDVTTNTASKLKTGKAGVIEAAGGKLQMKDREFAAPARKQVLLKMQACGVCHSDSFAFSGHFPGLQYPSTPGHEIVGIVEEIGADVKRLKKGDRVGVGWHGGHCSECTACRAGDFISCNKLQTPGITFPGGYSEYGLFPEEVCAVVPEKMSSTEAAPLLCAGVTTFNALRHSKAIPGDTVAVLGLGGLGHLAVQYANKMGYHTVAIARGDDKKDFAFKLGAHAYINSETQNGAEELQKLGGAKVILATVTNSKAMSALVDGLCIGGQLLIVGADIEPLNVSPIQLIGGRKSITGWPSGTAKDSEDCLRFSALHNIKPMVELFSFAQANEAYERMMSGKARFRAVIDFSK